MPDKATLRKVYLEKRMTLSSTVFKSRNAALLDTFISNISLAGIEVLHLFLPIGKWKEVDTFSLLQVLKKSHPHLQLAVPKVIDDSTMAHYLYEGPSQLELNKWDIPEPKKGTDIRLEDIDMVLVPLICFDRSGQRIGYGKGYYDRFLAQCSDKALKIGLSLSPPLDSIPYATAHDVPLDFCITPKKCYSFKRANH